VTILKIRFYFLLFFDHYTKVVFFLLLYFLCLNSSHLYANKITFFKDIKPIITKHCIQCHHPTSDNSIDFTNDQKVVGMHQMIHLVTSQKIMPPWPNNPDYGRFHNENFLMESDLQKIQTWSKNNAPLGQKNHFVEIQKPKKKIFRNPDFVIDVDTFFVLSPQEPEHFFDVYFKSKLNFPKTTHIQASQFELSNKKLAHHMRLDLDSFDNNQEYKTKVYEGGRANLFSRKLSPLFSGYLPGADYNMMPKGFAVEMYSNPLFYASLHLISNKTKVDTFRFRINLWKVNDSNDTRIVIKKSFVDNDIILKGGVIPKDSMYYINTITEPLKRTRTVVAIWPHMHYLGDRIKIGYVFRNDTTIIQQIDKWNFNWQYKYFLKRPLIIPKGAQVICEAVFNNTRSNQFNPNSPPIDVKFGGMRSTDEMLNVFFFLTDYMPGDENMKFEYEE
jgi:hypothetical protein